MSKINIPPVSGGFNLSQINSNFDQIEQHLNDRVLYRDVPTGEPNQMVNDLDMNTYRIYNLPEPVQDHEPLRKVDADKILDIPKVFHFQPPVIYTEGLNITNGTFTVDYQGVIYSPRPSYIPFTTGVWDTAQWSPVQNTNPGNELLVFDDYATAATAAATLPDGQRIQIPSDATQSNRLTIYSVGGGAANFERFGDSWGDRFEFGEIPLAAKTVGWALQLTGLEVNALSYVPIGELPALFNGTSTYDCAPAINTTLTANPGKNILIPLRMRVAAPVIVKTDNTGLVGFGPNTSALWRDEGFVPDALYGNNTVCFCAGTGLILEGGGPIGASQIKNPVFSGLSVESTTEMDSGSHLYMHTPVDGQVRFLQFKNGFHNVHLRSMVNCFVRGVHTLSDHSVMTTTKGGLTASIRLSWSRGTFFNNTGFLDQVFVRGTFPPSHTKGHETSLAVESCDGLWVTNCYFGNAATQNILIQPYVPPATSEAGKAACFCGGFKLNNVWCDYANGMVISDAVSHTGSIRGIELHQLSAYGYEGYGTYGVVLNAETAVDVSISGGRIWDFGREGIDFRKGNHVRINGIAIRRCNRVGAASTGCIGVNTANAATGPKNWSITNSSLGWQTDGVTLAGTGRAIYVGQNCDYFRIKDNDLTGNQNTGVFNGSSGTATNYEITNNFGFKTENRNFATIVSGASSVTINHGLDVTPVSGDINLTVSSPATLDFGVMTVSNTTSTQFTVNVTTAPTGANAINFRWDIKSRG